jgi:hypothetical protein
MAYSQRLQLAEVILGFVPDRRAIGFAAPYGACAAGRDTPVEGHTDSTVIYQHKEET